MIPYAILSGKIQTQQAETEIRILDLSEDGFTFRLAAVQSSDVRMTTVQGLNVSGAALVETDMSICLQFYCCNHCLCFAQHHKQIFGSLNHNLKGL